MWREPGGRVEGWEGERDGEEEAGEEEGVCMGGGVCWNVLVHDGVGVEGRRVGWSGVLVFRACPAGKEHRTYQWIDIYLSLSVPPSHASRARVCSPLQERLKNYAGEEMRIIKALGTAFFPSCKNAKKM